MQRPIAKYALVPIAAGIVMIAAVICIERKFLSEPTAPPSTFYSILPYSLKFGDHLAVALLSLGVIGFLLELPHFQRYFYGLFVDALGSDEWVKERSRNKAWAERIETTILTTVFGEDIKKEGSFFHDYNSQLRNFIGAPYRDKYSGTTTVEDHTTDSTAFTVVEVVSFQCCKMGDHIQSQVGWTAYEDELLDMPFLQITLQGAGIPKPIEITPDPNELKPHPDWGHMESLEDYKDKDGLAVTLEVHYVVKKDRAFSTNMGLITKGLKWTINYPKTLKIHVDRFVLDDNLAEVDTKTPGECTYKYTHWVLPGDGFAFHFRKP